MKRLINRLAPEARITLIYFILGTLWIVGSDRAVETIFFDTDWNTTTAQTVKGIGFIVFTSAVLYILLHREMARQRSSQQALVSAEADLRFVFAHNPSAMWIYDAETFAFIDVNQAALEQYGYTRDEFLTMRITDIRPPEEVPRLIEALNKTRPALYQAGVWTHRRKNGTLMDMAVASHKLDYAGHKAVLVVVRDVTEMLRAQRQLEASEARLNSILNAMQDVVWSASAPPFQLTYVSPAIQTVYGHPAEAFLNNSQLWFECIHPDDRVRARQSERTLLETGRRRVELRILHPNGEVRWIRDRAWRMPDNKGGGVRYDGITTNITDIMRMHDDRIEQEKLRVALNKESHLRTMRDRFTSMLAHEFRNPLTTILSSTDLLDRYRDQIDEDRRHKHLGRIREQVQHLVKLLDEVLAVMRAESVGLDFEPEPVDLNALCTALVNDSAPRAAGHTIVFQPVTDAIVNGDGRLLRRALDNLLSNAIKYSPNGSTVHVSLHRVDGRLRLQVRDEGIGIPADQLPIVFEPFKRASNTGSIPGTGLGLALVKQIADLHGGDIAIESSEGSGTTVSLLLDAEAPESVATSAPEAS